MKTAKLLLYHCFHNLADSVLVLYVNPRVSVYAYTYGHILYVCLSIVFTWRSPDAYYLENGVLASGYILSEYNYTCTNSIRHVIELAEASVSAYLALPLVQIVIPDVKWIVVFISYCLSWIHGNK